MILTTLMMAGALAFGHGPAADQKPYAASRANAIVEAAKALDVQAPPPGTTTVRYPSADGDILADLGPSMTAPPLQPRQPIAAVFPPMTSTYSTDTSGLLGGPKP